LASGVFLIVPDDMYCKVVLLIALCMLLNSAYAQNTYRIEGVIIDSKASPISDANIALIIGSDTLKTRSDEKGGFIFKRTNSYSSFQLKISHVGFVGFNAVFLIENHTQLLSLEPIKLNADEKQLAEVVIKEKAPPVVLKRDTIEYNISSFEVNDDDLMEDLLKKLPGLDIDRNGYVSSGGKIIYKLRVNGEDFFSGNTRELIKQLPAGIFSKVQIINDFGDDGAFLGLKKGPSYKLLNLVTQPGKNNGIFGNITASRGPGKQVATNAIGNYWKESKQISSSINLRTASNVLGSNNSNQASLNYSDHISKYLKIGAFYNLNVSKSSAQNSTFSETINSLGTIKNDINSTSFAENNTHSFNLNSKYQRDKKTYIKLNLSLSKSNSNDNFTSNSLQTGLINQKLVSSSYSKSENPMQNIDATIGRKLSKRGPVIMINFQYKSNNNNNAEQVNRNIKEYDTVDSLKNDSIFNTLTNRFLKVNATDLTVSFVQPLTSRSSLDLDYEVSTNKQKTIQLTDVYPSLLRLGLDSLNQHLENTTQTQKISINYRFTGQQFSLTQGISGQKNSLSTFSPGSENKIKQAIYNFSPVFTLSYNPSTSTTWEANYSGNSQAPSIEELNPVPDIRDIQNIIIGNPNLKTSFNNRLEFNFQHWGNHSRRIINAALSASVIQNKIVSNSLIITDSLNLLRRETHFLNASGEYQLNASYGYSMPIKVSATALKTSFYGNANFARQVVYADNNKAFNFSRNFSQTIKITNTLKHTDTEASVNYTASFNHYIIGEGLTTTVTRWVFALNENVTFFKNVTLNLAASKSLIHGYTNIGANNPFIVDATASCFFLKQKLILRLQASDILNQGNKISQSIIDNSIVNNKTSYLSQFVLLSLTYRISKFGHLK